MLFKLVFLLVMLFLLVLIGMYNKQAVGFVLPPLLTKPVQQPAAIMYFVFFAVGLLTGAVLTAGGKKGAGSGAKPASGGR